MLSKCNNPECSQLFRYLEGGRLFLLESNPELEVIGSRSEYFWLCPACSASMTLRLGEDETAHVTQLPAAQCGSPATVDVSWTERKRGLSLHSISSFAPNTIPRSTNNVETEARTSVSRKGNSEPYFVQHW
jgi:hypothetical protein